MKKTKKNKFLTTLDYIIKVVNIILKGLKNIIKKIIGVKKNDFKN